MRTATRFGSYVMAISFLVGSLAPHVNADPKSSEGRPFDPQPASEPLYAVSETTDKRTIDSFDGTDLFLETWLPVTGDAGVAPPAQVPTILVMSPYSTEGHITESYVAARDLLVPRGYAFTMMHTRGTGSSGGCLSLIGEAEAKDGAEVIQYIGSNQVGWSDGTVGTFGTSYPGGTQIATAAGGDPEKTKYLKAMVVGAPAASWYDVANHDGVPALGSFANAIVYTDPFQYSGVYDQLAGPQETEHFLDARTSPGGIPIEHAAAKGDCLPDRYLAAFDPSGDVTLWYAERDWRRNVENITAATFMYHGHHDYFVPTIVQSGLFDRIQAPKVGIFGDFNHRVALTSIERTPSKLAPQEPTSEYRPDFWRMVIAWYDHHVKGLATGAESWPVAQVEGNDGTWRAEPNWPATGGPAGQLVLGAGTLGVEPTGPRSSTYTESAIPLDRDNGRTEGSFVSFDSGPLADRLEITGMPLLDLWLQVDTPDAHIAAEIETFDENGEPIESATRTGTTIGLRSMQHLESFTEGRFVQSQGQPAPVNEPFRTLVRFRPVDLVVPAGGRVTLTIAGMQRWARFAQPTEEPSRPSLANATVTVFHECERMSALRFVMPRKHFDLLDVATAADPEVQRGAPPYGNAWGQRPPIVSDGGGIATEPVCGQEPIRFDEFFGMEVN